MELVQGYRFAMDPTPAQLERLHSHCGAARFAFNTMLAAVKANLNQRTAERSHGVVEDELTQSMNWTGFGLQKEWNRRKATVAPWWTENSSTPTPGDAPTWAARWVTGRRPPTAPAPARFESKLPRLGAIRLHHSTRKLARRIEASTARITATTVSYRRGRWFVAFTVREERTLGRSSHIKAGEPVVGVDVGVRDQVIVATPDGVEVMRIRAPRHLEQAQAKLRALQRKPRASTVLPTR